MVERASESDVIEDDERAAVPLGVRARGHPHARGDGAAHRHGHDLRRHPAPQGAQPLLRSGLSACRSSARPSTTCSGCSTSRTWPALRAPTGGRPRARRPRRWSDRPRSCRSPSASTCCCGSCRAGRRTSRSSSTSTAGWPGSSRSRTRSRRSSGSSPTSTTAAARVVEDARGRDLPCTLAAAVDELGDAVRPRARRRRRRHRGRAAGQGARQGPAPRVGGPRWTGCVLVAEGSTAAAGGCPPWSSPHRGAVRRRVRHHPTPRRETPDEPTVPASPASSGAPTPASPR